MYKLTIFFTFTIFLLPSGCFASIINSPNWKNPSKYILRLNSQLIFNGTRAIKMYDNIELKGIPVLTVQAKEGFVFKGKQLCKWDKDAALFYKLSSLEEQKERYQRCVKSNDCRGQGITDTKKCCKGAFISTDNQECFNSPIVKSYNQNSPHFWLEFDDIKNDIYISEIEGQKIYYKHKLEAQKIVPARITMKKFIEKNPDLGKLIGKLREAAKNRDKEQLIKLGIKRNCIVDSDKDCFVLNDKIEKRGGVGVYERIERLLDFSKIFVEYTRFKERYGKNVYHVNSILFTYGLLGERVGFSDYDEKGNYLWKAAGCILDDEFEKKY